MNNTLKIPQSDDVFDLPNNCFWFQWCCGCGLRHAINMEVIRAKQPENDTIRIRIAADEWATKARKKLKRLGVSTKKKRK